MRAWWCAGARATGTSTACRTRPTGLVILTEATRSPDPLIELANRLSRMTDWAVINATEGIKELSPRVRKRITTEVGWFNRRIRLRPGGGRGG